VSQADVVKQIEDVVAFLGPRMPARPDVAIILGSGLGAFANRVENSVSIAYKEIPHFQVPAIDAHKARLVFGKIGEVNVAVLQGRWHFYEGYPMSSVVIPTRALALLGAHTIVLTNAAGGVNLNYQAGDLMVLSDHLNLMGDNPLTGQGTESFGPRYPDMSEPYCKDGILALERSASKLGLPLKKGVYAGVRGPTYETPAEVRMMRILGGDAVGMSTVPEAIAARHLGMRVIGISCITNMAAGIEGKPVDFEVVQESASGLMEKLSRLVIDALPEIARNPGREPAVVARA
jgi:purine-nucleoside phosphorylase